MAKTEYRWVGTHVQDLADGRMLGIGEFVDLTDDDIQEPHNAELIERGELIVVPPKTASHTKSSAKTEGDSE